MTKEGTVLDGKYEIWKEVGRGGMSIVYLARDNRLNKQWAVKEIRNDGSKATDTLLKGLEREANILKNVDHPVLPRIVDIIDQKGTIYVVMDFIEGETISQRLKREGAQDQETVIDWGIQLASALDYLHKMDPPVIYRDMKPSNVMIKPEGGVKLIDFGTAKEYDVENLADTTALGTKGYAAPEQFGDSKGRGIYNTDERTDIYNLGATLYHMVTGKNPCEPPYEMRPIREWNPALSTGLEKIIWKCIQSDPKDRYQNCSELIYDLEHYDELDDSYRRKNKFKFAAFAATLALSIVGLGIMIYGHKGMDKIRRQNYNEYMKEANVCMSEDDYTGASEKFELAIETEKGSEEAYLSYLSLYQKYSHQYTEDGKPLLDMETGLRTVCAYISQGAGGIDKNNAVLFRVGSIYFEELDDYVTAAMYLGMVDPDDPYYGRLADYYYSVATIKSQGGDVKAILEKIDQFAAYNSEYSNEEDVKFLNYKMIGKIYTSYVAQYDGVAEKANAVMQEALENLKEYVTDDDKYNDYYYNYCDNLVAINSRLAKDATEAGDTEKAAHYYQSVIEYCDVSLRFIEMKGKNNSKMTIGDTADNTNNTDYYNKMMRKVSSYQALGDYKNMYDTCEQLEARIGKQNCMSAKIYTSHILYYYEYCESKEQDRAKWKDKFPEEYEAMFDLYEEAKNVKGIDNNGNWESCKDYLQSVKDAEKKSEQENNETIEEGGSSTDNSGLSDDKSDDKTMEE